MTVLKLTILTSPLLLTLVGCGGFSGLGSLSSTSLSSLAARVHRADTPTAPDAGGNCPDGSTYFGNGCYPVLTTDISSRDQIGVNPDDTIIEYTHKYQLNDSRIGVVSIKGNLVLNLDKTDFAENLLQIGFAPTCDSGFEFFSALIIKSVSAGKTSIPVNYTFNEPISQPGCVIITYAGDTVDQATTAMMINNLKISYVTPSQDINVGKYQLADGHGNEFCLGYSGKGCLKASTVKNNMMQSSYSITQAGTLRQIFGSISDAPWALTGMNKITGAWSATDVVFIDRGCAATNLGDYGAGNFQMTNVADADVLVRLHQDIDNPQTVAQQFINLDLNTAVTTNDCLVHRRLENSDGIVDMETQLMILVDPSTQQAAAPAAIAQPAAQPVAQPVSQPVADNSAAAASAAANQAAAQAQAAAAQAAAQAAASQSAADAQASAQAAAQAQAAAAAAAAAQAAANQAAYVAGHPYDGIPTTPVYRWVGPNGRHTYSTDSSSAPANGYSLEGQTFSIYTSQVNGLVPLNVCASGQQRFLSTDNACEGSSYVRTLGYISAAQFAGAPTALYRFDLNSDWLTTAGTNEGTSAGYRSDGIIGFVP